jgi:hypothetical protein
MMLCLRRRGALLDHAGLGMRHLLRHLDVRHLHRRRSGHWRHLGGRHSTGLHKLHPRVMMVLLLRCGLRHLSLLREVLLLHRA